VQQPSKLCDELRQLNGQVRELFEQEPKSSHLCIIGRLVRNVSHGDVTDT